MPSPTVRRILLGGYDPATQLWASAVLAAGGSVSNSYKQKLDKTIRALKSHGLFSVHDRIWVPAEDAIGSTIDIVNRASMTNSGATFTALQGFAGNASTTFVNTNFAGSTNGVNYTRDSASMSCYVRTNRSTAANKAAVGFFDDGGGKAVRFFPHASGSVIVAGVNIANSFPQIGTTTNAKGFYTLSRTGSTTTNVYKNSNATSIFSPTDASVALSATTFFIGAENVQVGADTWFSDDQIAMVAFGAGLTAAQAVQFQTDINDFMKSLGTNVY